MAAKLPSVETVFSEALEIASASEREAFLDRTCGGDGSLREQVASLLDAHLRAGGFLESPALPPSTLTAAAAWSPDTPEGLGTVIGPYRLLEQIGEGGMGVVYMAEQTHPVRRRVALKVIKPGMDTRQVIARFGVERQALAMMDHPNIAKVHDAGTTDSGRPYFVMELVRGIPITEHCDREQLSISERLELFVLVCRAVQHAHQKGIIHRDLKPSNVLITLCDGVPIPKVIDFGIAKATGQSLTENTLFTGFAQLVGTPLYMSPEQAGMSGIDVDTRSDIYSLGVLLYELLTGSTPFDGETFRKAAIGELQRIIREDEPPTPSSRLSELGETLSTISANRHVDSRKLSRSVRGELDWIVMKALEKDRRRRFQTANDFAADVMRHLTDQPVEACPPSSWYRFGKFARRNRVGLTTTALVATALIAGTAVSLWQARRAAQASAEAARRADESRRVVDYLVTDVFAAAAPGKGRSRSVTIGELLDQADVTVSNRLREQPLVEASVRMALAESCWMQGDLERAERHAVRAVELRSRLLGPEHPETLRSLHIQARIVSHGSWKSRSKWEAGVTIARTVLAAHHRNPSPDHAEVVETQALLANTLLQLGRSDEALGEALQAEALALRVLGPDHAATLDAWGVHGCIAAGRADRERAESLLRRSLAGRERLLGALDPETIGTLNKLAELFRDQGRLDEARPLYLEVVDRQERYYGITHIAVSYALGNMLSVFRRQGDTAAIRDFCEGWLREILATPVETDPYQRSRRSIRLCSLAYQLAVLPDSTPLDVELAARVIEATRGTSAPGLLYYRLGEFDKAEAEVRSLMQSTKGGDGWEWINLARLHARRGERLQSRELYDRAVEWQAKQTTPFSPEVFEVIRVETEALMDMNVPTIDGSKPQKAGLGPK